jgi:glycosyltransferase involved in cell wall biosynthesis
MKISIDVIMPTFRLEEKYILPVLRLPRPESAEFKFYLVADNPAIIPSDNIRKLVDNETVFLYINEKNTGASGTRRKAMDVSRGDWILMLDDDIVVPDNLLFTYAAAAARYPDETGFLGLINMPPPPNHFARALQINGNTNIFSIAANQPSFTWGATANVMVRRSAVGSVRFSENYPRAGGGEDVDFFLQVRDRNNGRNFRSLPEAAVTHPWWDHARVNYRRTYNYAVGNSRIGRFNPSYTYRNLLNTPETIFLCLAAALILWLAGSSWAWPVLLFAAGALIAEAIATAVMIRKRFPGSPLPVLFHVIILKLANDTGDLWGKLSHGELYRIGERFDETGTIKKNTFFKTNTYKIVKWVLYALLLAGIILPHLQ